MDWVMINTLINGFYSFCFVVAVIIAGRQLILLTKTRKFEMILTIFRELKTKDFMAKRRYIYDNIPENIDGIDDNRLKKYLIRVETALTAFDRVGYLLRENHIDAKPIMDNYWASVWRCWKKTKNIIIWARQKREQEDYFINFEHLFSLAEEHRVQSEFEEPKFYSVKRIIT